MPKRTMNQDDPLDDFDPREITLDGVTRRCTWPAPDRP